MVTLGWSPLTDGPSQRDPSGEIEREASQCCRAHKSKTSHRMKIPFLRRDSRGGHWRSKCFREDRVERGPAILSIITNS